MIFKLILKISIKKKIRKILVLKNNKIKSKFIIFFYTLFNFMNINNNFIKN